MVKSLSAYGVKQEDIAKLVGLRSVKTLRKYFRERGLDLESLGKCVHQFCRESRTVLGK